MHEGVREKGSASAALFAEPPDARIARVAAAQHGRISTAQLRACGLSRDCVARRVRNGQLHRVHYGVYAVGHAAETLEARFIAAVLAGGAAAFLCHWSALALWGLRRPDNRAVDVGLRTAGGRRRDGIRFHNLVALDALDITRRQAIPVTTAARALVDVAPQLTDTRLRRLVRKAQAERVATVGQLAAVLARVDGLATSRIAALIADGHTPTYSGDEDAVLDVIFDAGIERPQINAPLRAGANTYYPDMRWPGQRLILEVDSRWHDGVTAQRDDAARQADLEAAGERVLRTTLADTLAQPGLLVTRLLAAGAPRRR